jgi:hypothetical protein
MLWNKAWLETRSRFVISLVGCVAFCLMWVVEFGKGIAATRGQVGLYDLFHTVHAGLCFCWVLGVTFLIMGGLLQENAVGASVFTLGLPVSRLRHMSVHFGVGFKRLHSRLSRGSECSRMASWWAANSPFGNYAFMYFCRWAEGWSF